MIYIVKSLNDYRETDSQKQQLERDFCNAKRDLFKPALPLTSPRCLAIVAPVQLDHPGVKGRHSKLIVQLARGDLHI